MKINPKYGDKIIALPSAQVLDSLKSTGEAELKVLIYSLAEQNCTAEQISDATGLSKEKIKEALIFWRDKGAISVTGLRGTAGNKKENSDLIRDTKQNYDSNKQQRILLTDSIPRYTEEEVAKKLIQHPELKCLIDDCCHILDRMLNETEAGDIVVLYDYLHLGEDYIMLLCSHCASRGKTSLMYIKKVAADLFNEGITDYSDLEAYYERIEAEKGLEGKIRKLFGMGGRRLSPTEKEAIHLWTEWNISDELIEKAFDATVTNAEKATVKYMHGIIKRWHGDALDTPEKVDAAAEEYRRANPVKKTKKKTVQNDEGSFDTKDFFEAALRRSYSDNN